VCGVFSGGCVVGRYHRHVDSYSAVTCQWPPSTGSPGQLQEILLSYFPSTLAKLKAKNQPTLPKRAVEMLGPVTHFEVAVQGDRLVLTPARRGKCRATQAGRTWADGGQSG